MRRTLPSILRGSHHSDTSRSIQAKRKLSLFFAVLFLAIVTPILQLSAPDASAAPADVGTFTYTDSTCKTVNTTVNEGNGTAVVTLKATQNGQYTGSYSVVLQRVGVGHNLVLTSNSGQYDCAATGSLVDSVQGGVSKSTAVLIGTASGTTAGATNGVTAPTCDSSGNPLAWLMCPIISGAGHTVDAVYGDIIQPLLVTEPINVSSDSSNSFYKIWSNFRTYGNVFLVIAVLVIVFGQSIGGGLIDAYSAKKILPRILIAAMLINLSIYIVAVLVDVTNILGAGVATLMTQPFTNAGAYKIAANGVDGAGVGVTALLAVIWGVSAGTAGLAAAAGTVGFLLSEALPFILLFIILPALLIMLSILMTIIIRRGLIVFLVLISPVAFALYCLPNTEKYFRQWWDTLFKTLLIYPIIAVLFALANILSVTITSGTQSGILLPAIANIMSLVALLVPLFLIPFSFRLAGGVLGKVHDTFNNYRNRGQEAIKGNANDPLSLRNRAKSRASSGVTRVKAQAYRDIKKTGRFGKLNAFMLGNSIEQEAHLNEASKRRVASVKDNGDDSIVNARASFVDDKGQRRTLDGKPVSDTDWQAAKMLYPSAADVQTIADYRSTKVNSTEEAGQFLQNYGLMAQQQGMSLEETNGQFTGLAFARQNERGEFKQGKYIRAADGSYKFQAVGDVGSFAGDYQRESDGTIKRDSAGVAMRIDTQDARASNLVKEAYTKKGAWESSKAFGSYYQAMGDVKAEHLRRIDTGTNLDGGALTTAEIDTSRNDLKKIVEMEDAWTQGGKYRDPDTGAVIESGMNGASAETMAAFNKMRAIGRTTVTPPPPPPTPPGGPPAPTPPPSYTYHPAIAAAKAEIVAGNTYDASKTPTPGDFTTGSRPYKR